MKIIIGCDKLGIDLKNLIIDTFSKKGHEFTDVGVNPGEDVDYPITGEKVAEGVASGGYERGILICGTGIGMAIAANKVPGVRAAVCHDIYSTERSVLSNNAQVMSMGAIVIGPATATTLVDRWLSLKFDEKSQSAPKVEKLNQIDQKYKK